MDDRSRANHPYAELADRAYWRKSVAARHFCDLEDLADPVRLSQTDRVATAGSCFAQHIGRRLKTSGARFLDLEPRPGSLPEAEGPRFGFDIYSCRYGNIYTARQLRQLAEEAFGLRQVHEPVWTRGGRFFDALRPSVDPAGHDSDEHVRRLRQRHLAAVACMLRSLDVFIFTLGLTESWVSAVDDTAYPSAAGVIAGSHDPARYRFKNFRFVDIRDDLVAFWALVRKANAGARMVLTVSPVPLIATASSNHVLVANTESKAVLRAVAGELAATDPTIGYFPSYEIIATHPSRAMFFEPDLRSVNDIGVNLVMKHFFASTQLDPSRGPSTEAELICDEEKNDPAD